MQLKTSWFNKEIMMQSFRNVGWIGIIYLVGLFFALPLQILMEWSNQQQYNNIYNDSFQSVFSVMFPVQIVLMFAVPILLAIFLFRFLQVKSASDFIHSLPIKRTTIYSQYAGLGFLYLIVPILLTAIALLILHGALDLEGFFTAKQILSWAGVTTVVTFLVFLAGVFIGMITGLSAVQGVLTFIFLLFPAGITGLVIANLDLFLFGFVPGYYFEAGIIKLSPVTRAADFFLARQALSTTEIIVYLALTVVFYSAGLWLYKKRNLETVSQAIVFRQLRPVFKYSVTFCAMLFGGFYFGETQNTTGWTVFGYVIGSLIGYFIAEMLLRKTWRVFTNVKGYFFYALTISILGLLVHFDVTGYQQRVPELDEIEQIYFAEGSYEYIEQKDRNRMSSYVGSDFIDKYKPFFKEPENIQAIQNLHKQVIENKNVLENSSQSDQRVFIAYELKNGRKVIRQYDLTNSERFSDYLAPIYGSMEYKKAEYEVLHIEANQIDQIKISPDGPVEKTALLADPEVVSHAVAALKADVLDDSSMMSSEFGKEDATIRILLNDDGEHYQRIDMPFKQTYTQFESVLKQQGKLEEARITAEDISVAVAVKREYVAKNQELHHGWNQGSVQHMLENEQARKITDAEQIEIAWNNSEWEDRGSEYFVGFQFKENNFYEVRTFSEGNVPEFIKEYWE